MSKQQTIIICNKKLMFSNYDSFNAGPFGAKMPCDTFTIENGFNGVVPEWVTKTDLYKLAKQDGSIKEIGQTLDPAIEAAATQVNEADIQDRLQKEFEATLKTEMTAAEKHAIEVANADGLDETAKKKLIKEFKATAKKAVTEDFEAQGYKPK